MLRELLTVAEEKGGSGVFAIVAYGIRRMRVMQTPGLGNLCVVLISQRRKHWPLFLRFNILYASYSIFDTEK